jgi:hypothetical protein
LKQGNLTGKADVCLIMPEAPLFGRGDCEKTFCHKGFIKLGSLSSRIGKKRNLER